MFSEYAWAIIIVLIVIMMWNVIQAIIEDKKEFDRLMEMAKFMPEGTSPTTHSKLWRKEFISRYGKEPAGNQTPQIIKNTLTGTIKGCVLGMLTGGPITALEYGIIHGMAAPTLSSATESWINSDTIIRAY